MLAYYRNNWQNVGMLIFGGLAVFLYLEGSRLSSIQIILVCSYMALLAHQYEEYGFPGGAALVINAVMYGERRDYDRYPGNKMSMTIVNTVAAYPFYLSAILFPDAVWLGLAVAFFGFFQLIGHGLVMNIKGRTRYNPGLATTVLLLIPTGACYVFYVTKHGLASTSDYVYGTLGFFGAMILILALPIRAFMDRNSPYPMSVAEMSRFNMLAKVKAKGLVDG